MILMHLFSLDYDLRTGVKIAGVTAGRVLVHVDSGQVHEKLVNSRLAYVALSRGRYDAQIYTDDAESLGAALSREVSKTSAIEDVPPF
jgi:ATP-dependent exoDNAse (exonuclease V) alpha subunit